MKKKESKVIVICLIVFTVGMLVVTFPKIGILPVWTLMFTWLTSPFLGRHIAKLMIEN